MNLISSMLARTVIENSNVTVTRHQVVRAHLVWVYADVHNSNLKDQVSMMEKDPPIRAIGQQNDFFLSLTKKLWYHIANRCELFEN